MKPKRKKSVQWDSERIKSLRSHLKKTQQGLADDLGTRQQTISDWENGYYRPRGTSNTLLNIVAERSNFRYRAKRAPKEPHSSAE